MVTGSGNVIAKVRHEHDSFDTIAVQQSTQIAIM